MSAAPSRQKSYKWGLQAENLSLWYLRLKGYRLLARRAKTPVGEIDIIVTRRNVLIAVEVKARKSIETAAYSITPHQQKRISKALEYWLQQNPKHGNKDVRFDAVLMRPWALPIHYKNAW